MIILIDDKMNDQSWFTCKVYFNQVVFEQFPIYRHHSVTQTGLSSTEVRMYVLQIHKELYQHQARKT